MPKRVVRRIGRRGFVLFMMGWVFFSAAANLLAPVLSDAEQPSPVTQEAARYMYDIMPPEGWGVIMLVISILCFIGMVFKQWEPAAFFWCAFMWAAVAIGYAAAIPGSTHPLGILRGVITNLVIVGFIMLASTWEEN